MKIVKLAYGLGLLLFLNLLQCGDSLLMLGSMMLAAKTGLMMGKLGVGGMMMMLLAAQQQNHDSGSGLSYGKKRSIRSIDNKNDTTNSQLNQTEEIIIMERMVRQIDATFDTLTCIPKFICGMNAQPPSKKTSIINDYGHLLKLMLPRGESDDEDSEEEEVDVPKSKKDLTESLNKEVDIEDMVNEELIDDDPALLPYVLKDMKKKHDLQNHDPDIMSPLGMPHIHRPPPRRPFSPLSSFSSYLPKLEAGLGTRVKDSDFADDPFFDGFRSLKSIFENATKGEHEMISILDLNDTETENVRMTRKERLGFIQRMAKELEKSDDPIQKYRIATEVGKKLKNKEDCTKVFKKCPYKWEEVTGVVTNLRNSIANHPAVTGKPAKKPSRNNKVVYVKTITTPNSNQSLMSFATSATKMSPNTVIHDLGNGNLMEISMKLIPMIDVPTKPVEEDLEVYLKPGKERPVVTPEMIWSPDTFTPQILSEDEINTSALSFQKTNNGTYVKRYTKPGHYPILKESAPSMPTLQDGEDDEIEDALPVFLNKNKHPKQKKTKTPPPSTPSPPSKQKENDDEGDEYEEDDEDDDDDDDDDYEQEQNPPSNEYRNTGQNSRHRTQRLLSTIPPFPIVRGDNGQYQLFRTTIDLSRDEKEFAPPPSSTLNT